MQNKNENRFELREPIRSFLNVIKSVSNADAAVLYLVEEDMFPEEKKRVFFQKFQKRAVKFGKTTINENEDERYDILKFIGVADSVPDEEEEYWPNKKNHWKFDYKSGMRPHKYVIFKQSKDFPDSIKDEGITGGAARKNKIVLLDSYKKIQDRGIGERFETDSKKGIHDDCTKLIVIPLLSEENDGSIIGVIRLDIYRHDKDFNETFLKGLIGEIVENKEEYDCTSDQYKFLKSIALSLVDLSKKDAKEQSYRTLYKGEMLLEALMKLEGTANGTSIKKGELFKLIRHLLFVFWRYTYIGHDEICKRVLYFIGDLCNIIDLEGIELRREAEDLKKHEDLLLYDYVKYRDHFMHQFHVFIAGYIIIQSIGLDTFKKKINERLKQIEGYKDVKLDDKSILRIWAMTALFHDRSYILEKYGAGIKGFLEKSLNISIPLFFRWSKILSSEAGVAERLQSMCEFFKSPNSNEKTNHHELLIKYFQVVEEKQDHGVLSAALLSKLLIGQNLSKARKAEVYLAAFAISTHNSCICEHLKVGANNRGLLFEDFPMAFLLAYCDNISEWGRDSKFQKEGSDSYDSPSLRSFSISKNKEGVTTVLCKLKYSNNNHMPIKDIQEIVTNITKYFHSKKHKFKIQYIDEDEKQEDIIFPA